MRLKGRERQHTFKKYFNHVRIFWNLINVIWSNTNQKGVNFIITAWSWIISSIVLSLYVHDSKYKLNPLLISFNGCPTWLVPTVVARNRRKATVKIQRNPRRHQTDY